MEHGAHAWADGRPAETALVLDAIAGHSSELLALARRHSLCADDASDAYQRALLALLRHVDRIQPQSIVGWLRVVVRREAIALRRQRLTLAGDGVVDPVDTAPTPDERALDAEHRDRSAEALASLKPAQLRALLLKARGYSYAEIAEMTGWSRRQVDRALTEGRRALRAHVAELETGRRCRRIAPLLSALADGEARPADLSRARAHLRHCGHCRATLADFRRAPRAAAALAPPAVLAGAGADADHADPTGLSRLVDLVVGGAHERTLLMAHKFQAGIEAAATGKLALAAASVSAVVGGGLAVGGQVALPQGADDSRRSTARPALVAPAKRAVAVPVPAGGPTPVRRQSAALRPRASVPIRHHASRQRAAGASAADASTGEFAPGTGPASASAPGRPAPPPPAAVASVAPPSRPVGRTPAGRPSLPEFTP
jgi:RNA polymerase sigma factor (sigma-70 family)